MSGIFFWSGEGDDEEDGNILACKPQFFLFLIWSSL